jgi:primary-amine oxidase
MNEEWHCRTYFGFGQSAVPLEPLRNCPGNAIFIDAHFAGQDGIPTSEDIYIKLFASLRGILET